MCGIARTPGGKEGDIACVSFDGLRILLYGLLATLSLGLEAKTVKFVPAVELITRCID